MGFVNDVRDLVQFVMSYIKYAKTAQVSQTVGQAGYREFSLSVKVEGFTINNLFLEVLTNIVNLFP